MGSVCSAHDLGQSKLVKSLVTERVLISYWAFETVLLDDAVERLVVESVVSSWERQVFTDSSQLAFEFLQIAPHDEEYLSELIENFRFGFQAAGALVAHKGGHTATYSRARGKPRY